MNTFLPTPEQVEVFGYFTNQGKLGTLVRTEEFVAELAGESHMIDNIYFATEQICEVAE